MAGEDQIDLVASNIESMTVLEPGATEPKTLTVGDDSDPLLWFNVQKATGDYKYTVKTKVGKVYEATIEWTAPASVDAEATGAEGEHDGNYYVEYKLGELDLSSFTKMYQIKPNGEVSELTANTDSNLWFKTNGQVEGSHVFLVKQGETWYTATITYPTEVETATFKPVDSIGIHDGKVYEGYKLMAGEDQIDLVASNIESMTVLEPGATEPKTLTVGDDSDPLLWFNVQKATGDYKYTVKTKVGKVYEATIEWTAPASVDAEATGAEGEHDGNYYVEYKLGELDLSSFTKMYQIKPNGEVSELTANTDSNLWFKTNGQVEGSHVFLVKQGETWYTATITYPTEVETATFKPVDSIGIHDGKVYEGYKLMAGEDQIDLVASNIESMTVLEPGATEPKTLTVGDDSDPLLWFNVQKATGDYKYTVKTKVGKVYEATIEWTAPASVDAEATGAEGEHDGNYYVEYKLGELDLSSFTKMYQIKPNGEVSELTANTDSNLWFKTNGQVEGSHVFLVKQGETWYTATITYPTEVETATFKPVDSIGIHDGKVYEGYKLMAGEDQIDLVASNIESMTVLEPGATEPKTLTVGDDSDPLLWFNVQKATGDYKYTVKTKVGKVYEATIEWTAPASVDAEATGAEGEHDGNYYVEYKLGELDLSSFTKMYQIKPNGEVSELTANTDSNLWFKTNGQVEGSHVFLVKQGETWYTATITYPTEVETATFKPVDSIGIHDGKVYEGYKLMAGEDQIDLVASNIESMTVLEPGATEPKTLTVGDDSDPLLWFNVQKATGDYKYTVKTKVGKVYEATIEWTAPASVDAEATGAEGEHDGNYYVEYKLGELDLSSFTKMYQIKPNGEVSELTANTDSNLWFKTNGQVEGSHVFLVKQGETWYTATITYPTEVETATFKPVDSIGIHDGKVYEGYKLMAGEDQIDLVASNIESMTVLEPGATEPKTLTVGDDSDPLLWFNVQKATGDYKYTVVTKAGVTYVATLNWTAPAEVDAVKTGEPAYNQERENWYQLYTVEVDVDPEDSKVYQIKPDGEISELTVLADADNHLNIWFRLYGKDGEQQEGEHIFLIKKGDTWSKAVIDYGLVEVTRADGDVTQDAGKTGGTELSYNFVADGKKLTIDANNTKLPYYETDGSTPPRTANWVGVAIPVPADVDTSEVTATINGVAVYRPVLCRRQVHGIH
jgi:lipoprotein-anchoring transpeptidase ErfK/SrfK